MNVFVLCVGRCGSVTFTAACSHITNYTSAHESLCSKLGGERLAYSDNHIEVDNRLSWFLGRLQEEYGDSAVYVHLRRDSGEIAESYNKRWANDLGIMSAYAKGILQSRRVGLDVAVDMVQTVNENIEFFLRDKSTVFYIDIENPEPGFRALWESVGAEGDIEEALAEFTVKHNVNAFVPNIDASDGTEEEFIVKQFEERCNKLQRQYSDLKVESEALKSQNERLLSHNQALNEKIQFMERQGKALRSDIGRLRGSTSYKLGSVIVRNARSPLGWLKMPLAILRVVFSKPLKNNKIHPLPKKNTLWHAYQLARVDGWSKALAFAEEYAEGKELNALHLIRANLADTDDRWLEELNAYLAENDPESVVALRASGEERFYRLTGVSGQRNEGGPLISVIMPAFNAERTLSLAAGSILSQTHANLELIIVDDCSKDATYTIACKLAQQDSRVKVLRNAVNVGPYVSKNIALRVAKGDYITGHDADDFALPTRLSNDLAFVMNSNGNIKAVLSSMIRLNESGLFPHFSKVMASSSDGANRIASISLFIETKIVHEVLGGWDSVRFGADSEFIARAKLYLKDSLVQTNRVGMLCLDHDASLTNNATTGVDRVHGISPTRLAYREAWQLWHQKLGANGCFMTFPLPQRPYEAPDAMVVPFKDAETCILGIDSRA